MDKFDLKLRTKMFAHDCVKIALQFPDITLGRHIKSQLMRAATSVAANYRAACLGQTKPVFIAKLSIVIEEADESEFWLEFAQDEKLLSDKIITPIKKEAKELASIFIKSRKTAGQNLKR